MEPMIKIIILAGGKTKEVNVMQSFTKYSSIIHIHTHTHTHKLVYSGLCTFSDKNNNKIGLSIFTKFLFFSVSMHFKLLNRLCGMYGRVDVQ